MPLARILVIEDDPDIARLHQFDLTDAGYDVVLAADGVTGLTAAREQLFDAVILDLGLPDFDGSQIVKRLRVNSKVPILVVSAKDAIQDRLTLLNLGASDYLVKPFDSRELIARLQAKLRLQSGHVCSAGLLSLDLEKYLTTYKEKEVPLTRTEMKVLGVLMAEPGRLVTTEQMMQDVWPDGISTNSNIVAVHIGHIREKLREAGGYRVIRTVAGTGYAIRDLSEP